MVASQKTMDALKSIGLNKYERNLWASLLSKGAATAGELAELSKVPRSRCYDVLESLASKGFIMLQPGKPLKYVSLPPKEAMDRAKVKITEDAKVAEMRLEGMANSDSIRELEKLHKDNLKTTNTHDMAGSLKGRAAIYQQMNTMFKNAKKNVKVLTTEAGLSEMAENHTSHMKKSAGRGVKIQILAPVSKHTENTKALAKYAEIKSISGEAGRICIADGQEFVMGLTDDVKTHPTQDVAFWSQSGHTSAIVMEPMFNSLWTSAKNVK
jgi:HTH-type transcriptional regulator, sugar sensing transcriptional regulator